MLLKHFAMMLSLAWISLSASAISASPHDICGGFGAPETLSDLLRGRLAIRVPAGAEVMPNQPRNVMGPRDADETRSEVKVTRDGHRLRVIAAELFARRGSLGDADLAGTISRFIGLKPDEVALKGLMPATSLRLVAVEPRAPRIIEGETTVFGSVVEDADGFLIFVGNPLGGESVPGTGCSVLVQAMARSLSLGPRRLVTSEGWRHLGSIPTLGQVEVHLPAGWLVRTSAGADFDVWQLVRPGTIGGQSPLIGIYSGGHPSFEPSDSPSRNGRVLRKSARWYEHAQPNGPQTNVLIKVSDHDFLHIWIIAPEPSDSSLAREIIESLRVVSEN